jgi:hypothetical protein
LSNFTVSAKNDTTSKSDSFNLTSGATFEKNQCSTPLMVSNPIQKHYVKINLNPSNIQPVEYAFDITGGSGDFSIQRVDYATKEPMSDVNLAWLRGWLGYLEKDGQSLTQAWDNNGLPTADTIAMLKGSYQSSAPNVKATSTPSFNDENNKIEGSININFYDGESLDSLLGFNYVEATYEVKDNVCGSAKEYITVVVLFKLDKSNVEFTTGDYEQFLNGISGKFDLYLETKKSDPAAKWENKYKDKIKEVDDKCNGDDDERHCFVYNDANEQERKFKLGVSYNLTSPNYNLSLLKYGIKVGEWCGKTVDEYYQRASDNFYIRPIEWQLDKAGDICRAISDD